MRALILFIILLLVSNGFSLHYERQPVNAVEASIESSKALGKNRPSTMTAIFDKPGQQQFIDFIDLATHNRKQYRKLNFENNKKITFNDKLHFALIGWQYGKQPVDEVVLINLSSSTYKVGINKHFDSPAEYDQINMATNPRYSGARSLYAKHSGYCWNKVILKPYSVTHIFKTASEEVEIEDEKAVNISYLPVSGTLIIEGDAQADEMKGLSVYDLSGRHVKTFGPDRFVQEEDHVSIYKILLDSGTYSFRLLTESGEYSQKIEVIN